jgi:uncharacterized SAM-binding protein YcdF (DUF218 family)
MSLTGTVESLLLPVGFLWLTSLVVAVVAWVKKQRPLAFFSSTMVVLLHLTCGTNLSSFLLASLERPYDPLNRPLPAHGADAVVMLGGSHSYSRRSLVGWSAGEPSDRILAAVELIRQDRAHTLVLGGSRYETNGVTRPDSELLVRWFRDWQVPVKEVIELGICADTRDEARRTGELAARHGWKRVILVSSGYHLRRAEAVFRKAGVPVEPVGAEFLGLERSDGGFRVQLVPDTQNLRFFRYWLHEELGWLYYRAKGWL